MLTLLDNSRRRRLRLLQIVCLAVVLSLRDCAADELGNAVRTAMTAAAPSVVRIRTIGSADDDLAVSSQVTTGVVISEDREILTSVFGFSESPAAIFVEDADGARVSAKVVATDHLRKLVLLKCAEGRFEKAAFAKSPWPAVGVYCVAAGRLYPGSLPSASVGIVSAVKRIHGIAIQTDAKISPVNYGGPLLTLTGEVLGILVPLSPRDTGDEIGAGVEWYDSGIGFAIPAAEALNTAEQLRQGRDLVQGALGVALSTRNPLAADFHVSRVLPDSPAAMAGLKSDDVIAEVNGVVIDRFGSFQAIIKSSYAGDQLKFKLRRADEEVLAEVTLTDKLKQPPVAFLGLIIKDVVKDAETVIGVQVFRLPNSPLAEAGLPEAAIITEWDGKSVTSVPEFKVQLRSVVMGREISLSYVVTADQKDASKAVVVPGKQPEQVAQYPDDFVAQVCEVADSSEWKRQEEDLPKSEGQVWFYAPSQTNVTPMGFVVLLSASLTPQEVVIRNWQDICRRHNLIIAVPKNKEGTDLTREDLSAIQEAISTSVGGRKVDSDRVILVARKSQAEVCSELLLDPRLRQFRSAVFVESWPRVAGIPGELIARKSPSILVLKSRIQSRQGQALLTQAIQFLADSGAWVIQTEVAADAAMEPLIANWSLHLKAR